jgi:hypothetical protein
MLKRMKELKPLYQYMMDLRKADLQDIASIFGETIPDSWTKERMAHRLADIYQQKPQILISMFSLPVIIFLQTFFDQKLNGKLNVNDDPSDQSGDMAQVYDQLEYLGLVDYTNGKVVIPEFLEYVVSIDNLPSPQKLEEWHDMEMCALGVLDVYGLVDEGFLLDLFCGWYAYSREQLYDFLSGRIEIRLMAYCIDTDEDIWWFSDLIENPEEWYGTIQQRHDIAYRRYSKDELIDFAMFAFSEPPKNYDILISLLRKAGMSRAAAEASLEEAIMDQRCHLDPHTSIPGFMKDLLSKQSIRESRQLLNLYSEFVKSIPNWISKGHSSAELARQSRFQQGDASLPVANRSDNVIPFPLDRAGGSRSGNNSPCPCGSGKKFKDCCGKDKDK